MSNRGFILLSLLLVAAPLQAHLLKVFATAEGDRIEGRAYFAGGAGASGVQVMVRDPDGRLLAELKPDADGRFVYQARTLVDHLITVDSGDGHVAEWTIPASHLVVGAPATTTRPAEPDAAHPEAQTPAIPSPLVTPPSAAENLDAVVERAVARQIRPLREQLVTYEERVRLHDILGGLGYILGLAGLALWWHSRRARGQG